MIYIIMFLLLLYNCKLKSNKLYIFSLICLILVAGFRSDSFADYQNYQNYYYSIIDFNSILGDNYNLEVGYGILMLFVQKIFLNPPFYIFTLVVATISISLKSLAIKKMSINPYFSLLIYYMLYYIILELIQMRFSLAISFCFYGLSFLLVKDKPIIKDYILFYIYSIIGLSMHYSAFVCLFIPLLLLCFKKEKNVYFLSILMLFLMFIDISDIIKYINDYFIHSDYISIKLNLYSSEKLNIINFSLIVRLLMLAFLFVNKNDDNYMFKKIKKIYIGSLFLFISFSSIEILSVRGSQYYRFVEILFVPYVFESIFIKYKNDLKNNIKKMINYECLLSLTVIFYYLYSFLNTLLEIKI